MPNVHHRAKFRQNQPIGFGHIVIFDFQDGGLRPSWIFKISNFSSQACWEGQSALTILNLIKIGQTIAKISHLTVFKMAAICNLGFKNACTRFYI